VHDASVKSIEKIKSRFAANSTSRPRCHSMCEVRIGGLAIENEFETMRFIVYSSLSDSVSDEPETDSSDFTDSTIDVPGSKSESDVAS